MKHDNDTAAGQGQPMTINTARAYETPDRIIARLEARVSLEAENADHARHLCALRADTIERLSTDLHTQEKAHHEHAEALNRARDTFHIFNGEPNAFFSILEERHIHTVNHLGGILRWLEAVGLSSKALRQENPGIYPRLFTNAQLADVMECVAILLEGGADILKEGSPAVYPDPNRIFPDPADVAKSLEGLRADLMRRHSKYPGAEPEDITGPRYYCPTCRCHVHPEDLRPARPEFGEGKLVHCNEEYGRGCGQIVNVQEPDEPKE